MKHQEHALFSLVTFSSLFLGGFYYLQMSDYEIANFDLRVLLLHYWRKNLDAKAAAKAICDVEGEGTVSPETVEKRFRRFDEGDLDVDRPRSGRTTISDKEITNFELRVLLLHYWKKNLDAKAAAKAICSIQGEGTVAPRTAQKWFKRFNEGNWDLEDRPRSGRPTVLNDGDLKAALDVEPSLSTRELAEGLHVDQKTVWNHLKQLDLVHKKKQHDQRMADANGETNKSGKTKESKAENNENGITDSPSKLNQLIVQQVEYYFGDINLPKDKFMLEQIKIDDGWIPMSVMLKFQRLSKLTTDPKVIAKALEKSELIEVDESGEEIKIRRTPDRPLPEINDENYKELQSRSVYVKGFPTDYKMDDLINFFNNYTQFENIVMRKYQDKLSKMYNFKGSVFVTFSSKEKAQEFLNIPSIKCFDRELLRMWQLEYVEKKKKEIMENKLKKMKKANEAVEEEKEIKESFPKGATLHLTGDFTNLTREDIKEKFSSLGYDTAFVAFSKGEEEAHVRLQQENIGKEFLNAVGKDIEVGKSKLEARLLEGEEEDTFLKKAAEDKNAYLKKCHQSRQGGRKNRGRGKNSRKRKGSPESEATPPKKAVEAQA